MAVELRGAEQLAALSKQLKQLADRDLQRELTTALRNAMEPVKENMRAEAILTLPSHGGLNVRVAKTKLNTVVRSTPRTTGVRISAKAKLRRIDEGAVRHPVFGNRRRWVTEKVKPGWFTRPAEEMAPQVRLALDAAMRRIARKLG